MWSGSCSSTSSAAIRVSKSSAAAASAEEALEVLQRLTPDVISLDIRLPGMNGFDATRHIMRDKPTPIVVCSASVESEDLKITMNALRAGALAVVEKPVGTTRERLRAAGADPLHAAGDHERRESRPAAERSPILHRRRRGSLSDGQRQSAGAGDAGRHLPRMLGIGASTGGPNAVVQVLTDLGTGFPASGAARPAHHAQLPRRLRGLARKRDAVARGDRDARVRFPFAGTVYRRAARTPSRRSTATASG